MKLWYLRWGFPLLLVSALTTCSFLLNGCALSHARIEHPETGHICSSTAFTIGKDVSGAEMNCRSGWKVQSSDPNAQIMGMAGSVLQLNTLLLELYSKKMGAP